MKRSDAPAKQPVPFGVNGTRESLLATAQPSSARASYDAGFPPITMTAKASGGLPPKGPDFNQILYELSDLGRWGSSGALQKFDATFSTAISGYPEGALLMSDDSSVIYLSTVDDNTANPNADLTGWVNLGSFLGADTTLRSDLASSDAGKGASLVVLESGRTVQDYTADYVSVKSFGAVGDYQTDDTSAIIAADAYAASIGKPLFFPPGVYGCTNGIDQTAEQWIGTKAPIMGCFPNYQDDKRFLRPGYKHLIPGSCLIFKGAGSNTATTLRDSPFNSFTFCVKSGKGDSSPAIISNLGIVMDMDVLDASGNLTTPTTDNRSSYQVGLFCNDVTKGKIESTVFGYFPVAGIIHYGDDPDQTTFQNGSSSGYRGFVTLGTGSAGLSSTNHINWQLYAYDHHSRPTNYDRGNCLVIDGGSQVINGHFLYGGRIQTYGIYPVSLGNCNTVVMTNMTFELPDVSGDPYASDSIFLATSNTIDVSIINCRFTDNPIYGSDRLSGLMSTSGTLYIVGGPTFKSIEVTRSSTTTRITSDGSDNSIQLSSDVTSSTSGWKVRRRGSSSDDLQFMYANVLQSWLTTSGRQTNRAGLVASQSRGSATNPAIQLHSSDTTSGLFSDNANSINFAISGAKAWYMGSDYHFRPGADNLYNMGISSLRPASTFSVKYMYTATVGDFYGSSSPEGILTAGIGSTYRRTDGGSSTSFYVKESGTGNTGWVAK